MYAVTEEAKRIGNVSVKCLDNHESKVQAVIR
jgi:hypothetical protein